MSAHSSATRSLACAALLVVAFVTSIQACKTPNPNDITEVDAPPFDQFAGTNLTGSQAGVSLVLENRCGTLDCHGQVSRPLRIYGHNGLRLVEPDSSDQPGTAATTPEEQLANYQSVIGLQPEIMTEVYEDELPPTALMLLRKPLQLERHKGGAVFTAGDAAYDCITSWLAAGTTFGDSGPVSTDYASCYAAAQE